MKITDTTQEPVTLKETLMHNLFFWVCTLTSIVLIIISFILPPTGYIDPTVIMATGVLFAFASLGTVLKAMDRGLQSKVKYKDTELQIGENKQGDQHEDN